MPDFSFLDGGEQRDDEIKIRTSPSRPPAKSRKSDKQQSSAAGCLLTLILVGGCSYWVASLPPKTAREFASDDNRLLALHCAQDHIKGMLKAPRSAKWPGMFDVQDIRSHAMKAADGTYVVRSFVDSQNSFGAMLRLWYVVRLQVHANGTATILEAEVLEQD